MLPHVQQAWRSWKSASGVALLAVAALAVGIGSATAIYTVLNAVMLKPLPYSHGDRWVALYGARFSEPGQRSASTYPDMLFYQQRTHSFDVFGWFRMNQYNLTSPGRPRHIAGVELTPELASNLGVNAALGRWFRDPAHEPEGYSVAVISNALWKSLGARPDILGEALTLNVRKYTIIGVMPGWFRLPVGGPGTSPEQVHADVWIPLDPHIAEQDKISGLYFGYARMKPGVTFASAISDVKAVGAEIAKQDPQGRASYTAQLDNLRDAVALEIRPTLLLLFGAASLLLLITCANVSGLLVARTVARARETAIRVALGAAKGQLALQYFAEGLLVSLPAAAIAVLLSFALVKLVLALAAEYIPRADEVALDWTVLLFAVGIGCFASVLASFAPLWQALRTPPSEVLTDGFRSSASARSRSVTRALLVMEIALAFTLLTAGATLIIQLNALSRTSPGFNPANLLAFQVSVGEQEFPVAAKLASYQERLIDAIKSIPGVSAVAFANQLPLAGCCFSTSVFPEGRSIDAKAVQRVSFLTTSSGYLETMQLALLKGRFPNERDTSENPVFVAINEAAVNRYWPGSNPVGAYGHVGGPQGSRFQVIGIVGNVKNDGLAAPTVPEIYFSNTVYAVQRMRFIVRSPMPTETLVREVREAVHRVSPTQPVYDFARMRDVARNSLTLERVSSFMTGFFALAALLMATLGIYGVVEYSVQQRTVEFGTRMALGALGRNLLGLVVGDGLRMAAFGIAVGIVLAAATIWAMVSEFGVHEFAARAFVYSILIVAAVAASASFFPAWRATLFSPMVAIRNEPGSLWESARNLRVFSSASEPAALPEAVLGAQLSDAIRGAESFREAVHAALQALCEAVRCRSALLLQNVSNQEFRCVAQVPDDRVSICVVPDCGYLRSRFRFFDRPLPLALSDTESWLRWATERKPQYIPEIQRLQETGARLAVPLRANKELNGLLLLSEPLEREEYTAAEKRALRIWASQFELMLENARLTERIVEQEKLRRDLALAAEVQKRLLPEHSPEMAIGAIAAVSVPARSVGGDYYDYFTVGNRGVAIALADVAGKGVAAALITSIVHASLRIISADANVSLPELAARMNHYLYRSTRSSSYATFFYAQVDEQKRQLHYVNAGHNPPYLIRSIDAQPTTDSPGAEFAELNTGGTIIGMFPRADYEEATVDLRPGDVLVAFTDGIPEALNQNDEEFGDERLRELLVRSAHLPADQIAGRIVEEVKNWIQDAAQYDDLTLVVMKVS